MWLECPFVILPSHFGVGCGKVVYDDTERFCPHANGPVLSGSSTLGRDCRAITEAAIMRYTKPFRSTPMLGSESFLAYRIEYRSERPFEVGVHGVESIR